ncbi:MAG: hypothetical protein J6D37_07645 [Clostridia bacterium]|nr:hypothetical protein [Clostridia bacterium]
MKWFEKRGIGFYAEFVSAVAGVLALIVYLIYNIAISKVTADVLIVLLIGIAASAVALLYKKRIGSIATVVSVLGFALAFGLYLNDRIIMFEEMINHITGMTERNNILAVVIVIFVLLFVSMVTGIVASFNDKELEG